MIHRSKSNVLAGSWLNPACGVTFTALTLFLCKSMLTGTSCFFLPTSKKRI